MGRKGTPRRQSAKEHAPLGGRNLRLAHQYGAGGGVNRSVHLRHAYRANRVGDRVTLRNQHVYLTQLDASIYASAGAVLIGEVQISASERGGFFR